MNSTLIAGTCIVTCALISYSIAVITEQRKMAIGRFGLFFFTLGVLLDITATIFMIIGSKNIPITFHGVLGYSALTGMLIDAILMWRTWLRTAPMAKKLHLFTRIAYAWWVVAYFAGGFIAMTKAV
ncbi:MAG: hypothetical protein A2487_00765 [Candidatus Raymondbacteria bacterium RifOxyC12_full_50_8]|uniref:TIGR03987 family protein n=1 Tax=Candidatus Raymondbacteria bacterium RIFOXYD12_FULL_49_13 TaxID=1817890 RepID=A0A1F7F9Q9_UNCRA|nr:MAG: hypothetical protein A2350_03320 [Candidatus Raymondbacteria bacterium RifOxyB12_full_50_8]OGJ93259.1 MAG: hypothetical protein A2248_17985 [Candidatus Raymondbacteria bacterium RIFOXYA2_FULL_49_16]OGJ98164.1 MAG: hypothetical protein A2487_00765 [Candidatus Raymondbacteria bacterium RifOxyC12_full_50_8]OGK03341.1 MAG: hypothetical protein A2519_15330 [Candidatus Raymondbacteria bacterium RIFOXYD12_FULL_49_13]OGP44981.1 MAG: hypothetical protein A2324_19910 [Candidatus Raymondbacteria b